MDYTTKFLVDTISFRVKHCPEGFYTLTKMLGIEKSLEKGIGESSGVYNNNYMQSYRQGGIIIAWDGQAGFDGYIYMSGQGCRFYESLYKKCHDVDLIWYDFIDLLYRFEQVDEIHMTRIDIACDDFTDRLRIGRLQRYVKENKYRSRIKFFLGKVFANDELQIGSPKSKHFLRIYNKKLERGYMPEDLDGNPWYRCEFQLRDDSASQFIAAWVSSEDLSSVFLGYLKGQIEFLKKSNTKDGNQSDIPLAPFWRQFLGDVDKLTFTASVGLDYNLSRVERYAIHTAGSSVKTLIQAKNYDPDTVWKLFVDNSDIILRPDQKLLVNSVRGKEIYNVKSG